VEQMRGFLINKNLCFYYWLRRRIGKRQAYGVSNTLEKIILIFGREVILCRKESTGKRIAPTSLQLKIVLIGEDY
jgi:hypothetical protein